MVVKVPNPHIVQWLDVLGDQTPASWPLHELFPLLTCPSRTPLLCLPSTCSGSNTTSSWRSYLTAMARSSLTFYLFLWHLSTMALYWRVILLLSDSPSRCQHLLSITVSPRMEQLVAHSKHFIKTCTISSSNINQTHIHIGWWAFSRVQGRVSLLVRHLWQITQSHLVQRKAPSHGTQYPPPAPAPPTTHSPCSLASTLCHPSSP